MKDSSVSKKDQTNKYFGIDIVTMATLHMKCILIKIFRKKCDDIQCPKLRFHLLNCCSLLGLTYLQEYSGIGYESGLFKRGTVDSINASIKDILTQLRPQAIPLIEMWEFRDYQLTSAIGNSYGDIYETHLEWAKGSKLNRTVGNIPKGFMEYVHPIM